MKILYVTERFPYPLDTGGNVRSYHLLRGMARAHAITLLAGSYGDTHPEHVEKLAPYCEHVEVVPLDRQTLFHDVSAFVRSLARSESFAIVRHRRREMARAVGRLLAVAAPRFDAVYFNHLDAAVYLPEVPADVRKVLDEHNIVTNQARTSLRSETRPIHRAIVRADIPRLARFEAAIANQMDCCLVCSTDDAESLAELGVSRPITVVPNGVDTDYFRPSLRVARREPTLVFVGTMDYDPCEKAVWYFCNEVMPRLKQRIAGVKLVVVGRNPSARLQLRARTDAALVLTGRVPDVRPFLHQADVFVAPLLSGSGTRLKILEAMAAGIPVVSTSIGAEGIEVESGKHLWLADTPETFTDRIVDLLDLPARTESMRNEARCLMEKKYSWESVQRRLLASLRSPDTSSAEQPGLMGREQRRA